MKRLLPLLIGLTLPLGAQDKKPDAPAAPQPPNVQKLFILKYADPQSLRELLAIFGVGMIPNTEMHALAVTAPPTTMQSVEDAIAKLDVPAAAPKNFDFTVYLVVGTDADNPVSAPVPKDLDSVVAQLKGAFSFKNYRLLDILTLRTRAGKRASTHSSGGAVQVGTATGVANSNFSLTSTSLGADGTTVHLERLSCQTQFPYEVSPGQRSNENLQLDTDIDIKEGQKVVIGRMGMNSQQAMFVVLTVKVVQ